MDSSFLSVLSFASGALLGGGGVFLLLRARADMEHTFKALAADTLNQNSAAFLQLAEGKLTQHHQAAAASLEKKATAIDLLIKPVKETLQKMDEQLRALEIKREGAYRELAEMVTASRETQTQLRQETGQLLQALRAPTGRGRWGELQLQRLLEMTGMSAHARDFAAQGTITGDEGAIRPDVVVALPGGRSVIIDSKVPLTAYLDFVQSGQDSARDEAVRSHARQLKDHIRRLGNKAYWDKIDGTPEFVVLFLPGEHFLSAALDGDPDLMDYSATHQVVLATPMTLIALLRAVAYGWRQEAMRENVREVADLGRALHAALGTFAEQMDTIGSKLGGAVEAYNKTVRALERNVLAKARRLSDCGAGSSEKDIEEPTTIERNVRLMEPQEKEQKAS